MTRPWWLLVLLLTGCPEGGARPAAREPCARIGDRCTTPEGPLGVCTERAGECESPPCLACMPQH
ncbi:MAG: hypothetical protein RLP09_22005 [Sandaracinaceae bacterium]|nr:MAG: hypothetical protein EVA89_16305 [Sandaracinaceae bacterium]